MGGDGSTEVFASKEENDGRGYKRHEMFNNRRERREK